MPDLWSRIRQARLFQVLAVYAGASWIVLQVADVLVEALSLPSWVEPVAFLLLMIGALVIAATAWLQAHPPAPPESDGHVTTTVRVVHRWVLPNFTWRRALLGGVVAFLLLAGAAALFVAVRQPGSLLAGRASAEEAGVGIAVMPFNVTGGAEMDVWREGMLDLLATNLDGVGGLRTIDPRTIMARLRELDAAYPEAELPRVLEAGRRANARYALVGSVVALGPAVRLSAELHDLEGDTIVARAQRQGRQEDILAHVDGLSVEIMRGLLARDDGPIPGLRRANVTTSSLPAMKAFLEGEALYRQSRLEDAVAAYERAVTADSTFALAYWGLSWAWAWLAASNSEPSMSALDRALALGERLPQRVAAIAGADHMRRIGRIESIPMLEQVVARYPDDAEARYLLAEAYFHLGDQAVMPLNRSEDAFLRAIDLDPSVATFYYHVIPVAIARGDTSRARTLMDRLARFATDTTRLHRFRLSYQLVYGDEAERDSVARSLIETRTAPQVVGILGGTAPAAIGILPGAATLDALADLHSRAVESRHIPPLARVGILLERGRQAEAIELLRSARPTSSNGEYPHSELLYQAHLEGAVIPEDLVTAHLAEPDAADAEATFFTAAYAADRRDWTRVDRAVRSLERHAGSLPPADSIEKRLTDGARDALLGLALWKRDGRRTEAAAALERVRSTVTSMWEAELILQNAIVRWWLADLYLEMDRPDDAERYLESLWVPFTHYRLGVLYERQGRTQDAQRHYAAFMEKWHAADPTAPARRNAVAALERLAREGST